MSNTEEEEPTLPNPNNHTQHSTTGDAEPRDDDDDDDIEEEDDDDDDVVREPNRGIPQSAASKLREQRFKVETLSQRLSSELVPIRVHDVVIKGNTKTKDWVIEAELKGIENATSMQELMQASQIAIARLQGLEIFDSCKVRLEAGPRELPNTANVIVDVVETDSKVSGEFGVYTKPSTSSWTAEGALKYKNLLGYGDLWDASLAYGANQATEVSLGVYAPRVKGFLTPIVTRISMLSQDWQESSSYKERLLGASLGLISTKHHDLAYTLGWRTLTDPSQMSSRSIRRQLGHGLVSSLKYTFKIDRRNSPIRPTKGYAFLSTTHIGGLTPDPRSLRFLRQEFDVRLAVPFGFYNTALNLGISAGAVFPWGHGFNTKPSPLPERFYLGGDFSPVCTLGGPTTLWGFKTRGLGPTEPRRQNRDGSNDDNVDSSGWDFIGGDLAVTAFADLSFDLPIRWLREHGIHGHVFAGSGNAAKLTQNEYKHFSPRKFLESFRMSVGYNKDEKKPLLLSESNSIIGLPLLLFLSLHSFSRMARTFVLMMVAALLLSSTMAQSPASSPALSPTNSPVATPPRRALSPSPSPAAAAAAVPPSSESPAASPTTGISPPAPPTSSPSESPNAAATPSIPPSTISTPPSDAPEPAANGAVLNRVAGSAVLLVIAAAMLI